jgi:AAA+ superfamily predicted ATPase
MDFQAPQVELRAPQAYRSSAEHLRDELARVDLLVRAQVIRWRLTLGATKPEQMWGMVHVNDAEIEQYLGASVGPPDWLPESLLKVLRPFWEAEVEAGRQIRTALDTTPADLILRLKSLCDTFALSEAERDLLLVCLLPEIDFRYRRIFGYLQDDASRAKPPVELLLQIVSPRAESLAAGRMLFEPGGRLVSKRLLIIGSEDENLAMRSVRLDDRIASYLLDSDEPDVRLKGILSESRLPVKWGELLFDAMMVTHLQKLAVYAGLDNVPLRFHGPHGSGREKAARAICTQNGVPLLRGDVKAAVREPARWEFIVDLAYRETLLRGAALYWAGVEHIQQDEQREFLWDYLLAAAAGFSGITFLAETSPGETSASIKDPHFPRVDFPVPHYELRRRIWLVSLPTKLPKREEVAATLAGAFQFTEGQILEAIEAAREIARRRDVFHPSITREDLYEACRKQSSNLLLSFARRIEPSRQLTMDDLVLAEPNKLQLQELLNRIRLRSRLFSVMSFEPRATQGKGLLALFVGASGTGKTLAAELLASGLGVDLYKVDLAAVVSKWVGETEKNLNRIFAEAEDSNALLFFDECDALFGQRGEIKEAKDRWANLEVNYLLQRVEEYSGVVIMATNLRQNIDDAFLRRIQVIIEFPSPDTALRLKIWQQTLPSTPHSDVTEDELQAIAERFAITGGSIRNIVIDAAFRALAADHAAITVRDLVDSVAREYQKMGKPITQGDFGEEFFRWVVTDILSPNAPE